MLRKVLAVTLADGNMSALIRTRVDGPRSEGDRRMRQLGLISRPMPDLSFDPAGGYVC